MQQQHMVWADVMPKKLSRAARRSSPASKPLQQALVERTPGNEDGRQADGTLGSNGDWLGISRRR
jgi:hypothetical protein